MKTFWRFLSKSFLAICGVFFGVLCAVVILFGLILGVIGKNNQFVDLPTASGEVVESGKDLPIIAVLDFKAPISAKARTAAMIQEALTALGSEEYKERVKGIVLDVNCPGGEVFEIARVYSALQFWKQRTQCPIYIFVNGLCASGGYYIACAGDKIYATPASAIGSVGVLCGPFLNVRECLKRYGVECDLIMAGKDKAPMNPFTPWTQRDRQVQQDLVDYFYTQFVDVVVSNRPRITKDTLVNVLGAGLYSPQQSFEAGLIDVANATRQQVLEDLVTACGIEDAYCVIGVSEGGVLQKIMASCENSPLFAGKIHHELPLGLDNEGPMLYYLSA